MAELVRQVREIDSGARITITGNYFRAFAAGMKTNGPTREGITLLRWTAVFNPMSHVGTHAQQLDQWFAS